MPSKRPQRVQMYSPKAAPKPKIPAAIKDHAQAEVDRFVDEVLRPRFLRIPPEEPRFDYVVDVFTRWCRSYLYFCASYACPVRTRSLPASRPGSPGLSMQAELFHLAFMRHTSGWTELYRA